MEEETTWRDFVLNAVELAAKDPIQFRKEMQAIGRRLGMTAEEVYTRFREDPDINKKIAAMGVDRAIQRGAQRLQEELRKRGI